MKLVSNPQRTRLYVRAAFNDSGSQGEPGDVYEVEAGAPSGTRYAGDVFPVGFDADGTSYFFLADTLYRVTPEGTKTQVAQTSTEEALTPATLLPRPGRRLLRQGARRGRDTEYVVKLAPGQTQWETLAPGAVSQAIAVREDGLVLEYDPSAKGEPAVKELYGTGKRSLLVNAKAEGVTVSPSRVDLLGADEARVGFTVHEATRAEGLSVSAPTALGLTAQLTEVRRVPNGLAGVVRIQASAEVAPGMYGATVTSAGGQSARVEVRVEHPQLEASDMWQPTVEFTTYGATYFAVQRDGTVSRWKSRDSGRPSGGSQGCGACVRWPWP